MDHSKRIVRGRASGDDDVEGHKHVQKNLRGATDDDVEGHKHINKKVLATD